MGCVQTEKAKSSVPGQTNQVSSEELGKDIPAAPGSRIHEPAIQTAMLQVQTAMLQLQTAMLQVQTAMW